MEDFEEATQRIMERARQRKQMMRGQDGNDENQLPNDVAPRSPFKSSRNGSPQPPPLPSVPSPKLPVDDDEERRTYRKSRFSALAKEQEDWEFDTPPVRRTKDDYRKGVSPRLSVGENRPSILFTPAGGRSPLKEVKSPAKTQLETVIESTEKRRIHFTQVDESSNDSPLSSVHHETSSTVGAFSSKEVTSFADGEKKEDEEEEEFGTQSFLKKETRIANTSASSLLCSPKPFSTSVVNASHSPVRFTPTSSSPIRAEARMNIACTIPLDISSISPATHRTPLYGRSGKNVLDTLERASNYNTTSPSQITPSTAKHFFAQLPSKSPMHGDVKEAESSPVRNAALSSAKATTIRRELEMKIKSGQASMPRPAPSSVPSMRTVSRIAVPQGNITPSIPAGVRTQWRGTCNTPVVTGANPSEKTVPDVKANLASLRSRWEFSTTTGTPLHPNKSDRDLLDEAKKEAEKATYNKSGNTSVTTPARREERQRRMGESSLQSLTSSPVGKSPRLHHYRPETMEDEGPLESGEEEEMMEEDDREASRIIDTAFSFMENQKSPFKSVVSLEKVIEQTEDEEDNEKEEEERRKKEEEGEKREKKR
ncbi:hypothetical protein PENTCL1PPCAC_11323 [Pristionchus entomophagus]|uniref:Uncharacterized protein n=1 Tax=Pristionchus entomophagus TaxID=358040 RepID=A0AAV5T1G0_9BILA|nr:hypothetical protein PENTCL1PPCAC_11323 [Pristionchus entomophagus]